MPNSAASRTEAAVCVAMKTKQSRAPMLDQREIKQHDGGGMAGDRVAALARQEARAQPHEQNLHDAEVDQPQRIADGRDQNEDREPLRAEHMREHESLQQAGEQGGAGGGGAQQEEREWKSGAVSCHAGPS